MANYLPGGAAEVVDAYLALTVGTSALIAAAYGVTSALRIRAEETSGRAEPVLASASGIPHHQRDLAAAARVYGRPQS